MGPMLLFAVATLLPLPLITLGAWLGGGWAVAAISYMTLFTAALDELVRKITPPVPEAEFPVANGLSVVLALSHLVLLALVIAGLVVADAPLWSKVVLWFAAGLYFGQVSNSNAHELIHRTDRGLRRLGIAVYVSLLFGHHASAHVLVHHPKVATKEDPNSARAGESFYRFAGRAWRGSFRKGWIAERDRLARVGRPRWRHPYLGYLLGETVLVGTVLLVLGWSGLAWYLMLVALAQVQLLLSDYVQHYGLTRRTDESGKIEPVRAEHSWNSPHWFSSALMLNAPRHSDHHAHPMTAYPGLDLPPAPMLPRSLPVMACVALVPPLWRRVMDPRVAALTKS